MIEHLGWPTYPPTVGWLQEGVRRSSSHWSASAFGRPPTPTILQPALARTPGDRAGRRCCRERTGNGKGGKRIETSGKKSKTSKTLEHKFACSQHRPNGRYPAVRYPQNWTTRGLGEDANSAMQDAVGAGVVFLSWASCMRLASRLHKPPGSGYLGRRPGEIRNSWDEEDGNDVQDGRQKVQFVRLPRGRSRQFLRGTVHVDSSGNRATSSVSMPRSDGRSTGPT